MLGVVIANGGKLANCWCKVSQITSSSAYTFTVLYLLTCDVITQRTMPPYPPQPTRIGTRGTSFYIWPCKSDTLSATLRDARAQGSCYILASILFLASTASQAPIEWPIKMTWLGSWVHICSNASCATASACWSRVAGCRG